MRVGEAIATGFKEFGKAILSLGITQLYAAIKGAVSAIKLANADRQIRNINKQLEKLNPDLTPLLKKKIQASSIKGGSSSSKIANTSLSSTDTKVAKLNRTSRADIKSDELQAAKNAATESSFIDEVEFEKDLLQLAINKTENATEKDAIEKAFKRLDIQLQKRAQAKEGLKMAGLAAIPLAGAHLAIERNQARRQREGVGAGSSLGVSSPEAASAADSTAESIADTGGPIARKLLFPGCKSNLQELPEGYEIKPIPVKDPGGKEIRQIEAIFALGAGCSPSDRTVVLYHGNGMNGEAMLQRAEEYRTHGYNVLMPTMGGSQYKKSPLSKLPQDTFPTTEATVYQDVDAEMAFLKTLGVKEAAVHGLSMGGAKAFQAAKKYGASGSEPRVKFIIAEHTFTSSEAVCGNLAKKINPGLEAIGKGLGAAIGKGKNTPSGLLDGLDSLEKAKALDKEVALIAIAANQDSLMQKPDGGNFADDLIKAHYGEEFPKEQLIKASGGHCNPTGFMEAVEQIVAIGNTKTTQPKTA